MKDTKKRLWIYILLVFALTWAYEFAVVWPASRGDSLSGVPQISLQMLVSCCMFFPALCVLLTRLLTKEGLRDSLLAPRFKGHIRWYLLAWLGPGVLVILGAAVYFLLKSGRLDLSAGYYRQIMEAAGMPYEAQAVPMEMLLAIQAAQGVLLGGILNFIPALGEEWGWRGYLYPKLTETMGRTKALLLGGVIWGLWHAPLTALGHNYGLGYLGFPWTGIAAMCVFCIALGILFHWLTEKTGSCLPAAVAHGAINGAAALGTMLTADGGEPFVGPAPTGILGGLPLLVLAAVILLKGREKEE